MRGKDVATGESLEVAFDASVRAVRSVDGPEEVYLSPGWIDVQVNGFAGVDYNSAQTAHEEIARSIQVLFSTGVTRFYPTVITGGIAYWPVRDQEREWKLEVDLDYTRWSSFRNTDVQLSAPFSTVIAFPRNWKSTYSPMVGTEYKWLRPEKLPHWEVALRGGYWYGPNAVPDSTFSPSVPDSDNHAISIGLGLLCKEKGRFLGLFECGSEGGGKFRDVTREVGLAIDCYGMGAAVADYDNDGDPDLLLTAYGGSHLFRNNGNGTFTEVTQQAKVPDPPFGFSAAWFDYDRDGKLDLFVCNYCR